MGNRTQVGLGAQWRLNQLSFCSVLTCVVYQACHAYTGQLQEPSCCSSVPCGEKRTRTRQFMVFACADSRCCPSVTLDLQPGEAFTVRNIASMVGPYDKKKFSGIGSAVEYAVCALKVKVIVVIGHSRCGGIKALLSMQDGAPDNFHFVEDWVKICYPAKKKVQIECKALPFDEQCSALEKEAVNVSLDNLKTYPFVKDAMARGKLKLVAARYDFINGNFDMWESS